MDQQIQRITEMEGCLLECADVTGDLEAVLDRLDALRPGMGKLFRYYGSEDWYNDREKPLPPGFPAGVLSEDGVYDKLTAIRDASFRMLELATDILKNRLG